MILEKTLHDRLLPRVRVTFINLFGPVKAIVGGDHKHFIVPSSSDSLLFSFSKTYAGPPTCSTLLQLFAKLGYKQCKYIVKTNKRLQFSHISRMH